MSNDNTQGAIGHTLYAVAIGGILFLATGFFVIMATRLFTRIKKLPTIRECLYVGLAVWWSWWLIFVPEKSSTPKSVNSIHVQGYDYNIKNNRIEFVHPPTEELSAGWEPSQTGKIDNDPIYVHGARDGKNKVFFLSTSPDRIISADFGEGRGKYIAVMLGEGGARLAISKPYPTNYYRGCLVIFSIIFLSLGTLGFLSAQIRALENAPASRANMGEVR